MGSGKGWISEEEHRQILGLPRRYATHLALPANTVLGIFFEMLDTLLEVFDVLVLVVDILWIGLLAADHKLC